jgi:hypothetical protein
MSGPSPSSNIFRSEAIEYHCREQESIGIIAARMRWGWLVILISVVLLAASVTYAVTMRAEIVDVIKGRLDR